MIRVLHVLGGLERGGAETLVMNLYRKINREEIQFDFIIHTRVNGAYYEEITSLGGIVYHCPKYEGKNHFEYKKWWKHFFEQHTEYKIIHSHIRSSASIFLPIAKKYGLKTIIHSHSTSNGKGIYSIAKKILQYPLRYQADYLMACSNEAGEWLYGKRACKKNNYMFLPNAIDVEKYKFNQVVRDEYRLKLNIKDKYVIGHVGRFYEAKNHMFLIDVFKAVHDQRPDSVLLLVGDGDLRPKIEEKIKTLNIEDCVIMVGSQSNVYDYLQAMDVFVFPSLWEGLPVTVVEAQAAGLPCLISNEVTRDVNITELVKYLSIENNYLWINIIINFQPTRKDVYKEICDSGFDIKEAAEHLNDFYVGIYHNK